jgi:hypothetical protein
VLLKEGVNGSIQFPNKLKRVTVISGVQSVMIVGEVLELFTTLDRIVLAARRMGY